MNQPNASSEEPKRFTVVMRGPAALVFDEGHAFGYDDFPSPVGPVQVRYRSRWIERANRVRLPGQLWVEVNGTGPNFETVIPVLANAGLSGLPAMSVACNVAIQDPELEVAFDSTPGSNRREFLQAYVRPEGNSLSSARRAAPKEIAVVQGALAQSEYRDALLRASDQYRQALQSWAVGRESLTLAHLWMAVEALTKIQRAELLKTHNVQSTKQLASKLKVELKELDGSVRRDHLLCGDADCYKKAKEASDGFEHGYLGFDVIRSHAVEVRERLARYVRQDIFRLAQVPQSTVDALNTEPFDKPLGNWPLVKFFTSHLVGTTEDLGTPTETYPTMLWAHNIANVQFCPNGTMQVQFQDRMEAKLPPGLSFEGGTCQIWEGGSGIHLNTPLDPSKAAAPIVIELKPIPSTLGNVTLAVDDPATTPWVQPLGSLLVSCNSVKHFSLFWTQALQGPSEYARRPVGFARTVRRISWFLWRKRVPRPLRERCRNAWNTALSLDTACRGLAGGALQPDGLVLFGQRTGVHAPMVTDVAKLDELNQRVIATATELRRLFAELQALPLFQRRT